MSLFKQGVASKLKQPRSAQRRSAAPAAGLMTVDFSPNPGALQMRLYSPAGLPKGSPLVVVLHGCTQTGEGYASAAGWLTLAERYGFAVLCPEQTRANNPNLCFNWYESADAAREGGEAASIAAMVERAVSDHDLDARRVFVTGLSAGGAMTAVMLATRPEMFAGGAVIAGLPYGSATSLHEAFAAMRQSRSPSASAAGDKVRAASAHGGEWPPISIWHGQDDAIVRPAAGEALARQWTDLHGITGEPVTARTPAGRDFLVWLSPSGEPVVELHRIPDMGHGVPLSTGGDEGVGVAGPHMFEIGISSSLEIASGWGIVDRRLDLGAPLSAREHGATSAHQSARPYPDYAMPHSSKVGLGVQGVIESALRSAGLMK